MSSPSEIYRQEFDSGKVVRVKGMGKTVYVLVCRVCNKRLERDSYSSFHCSKECEQQDKEKVTND